MFTRIIEDVGEAVEARTNELRVRAATVREETKLGDSMAVDGVDLTVNAISDHTLKVEVMPETYRETSLSSFRAGRRVHLERAFAALENKPAGFIKAITL